MDKRNFAFFHDHFQTLKNLYYKYLENKLNEKIYYSDDKVAYLNKANRTTFKKQSWWNPKFYWDHIKTLGGYFKCPKEHIDKVESIVDFNSQLQDKIFKNKDSKFPSILTIDRDTAKEVDYFYLNDKANMETMKEINSMIDSNNTVISKVSGLKKLLDKKYEEHRKYKKLLTIKFQFAFI